MMMIMMMLMLYLRLLYECILSVFSALLRTFYWYSKANFFSLRQVRWVERWARHTDTQKWRDARKQEKENELNRWNAGDQSWIRREVAETEAQSIDAIYGEFEIILPRKYVLQISCFVYHVETSFFFVRYFVRSFDRSFFNFSWRFTGVLAGSIYLIATTPNWYYGMMERWDLRIDDRINANITQIYASGSQNVKKIWHLIQAESIFFHCKCTSVMSLYLFIYFVVSHSFSSFSLLMLKNSWYSGQLKIFCARTSANSDWCDVSAFRLIEDIFLSLFYSLRSRNGFLNKLNKWCEQLIQAFRWHINIKSAPSNPMHYVL